MRRSFCRMRGAPRLQPLSLRRLTAQLPETWETPTAVQARHIKNPQSYQGLGLRMKCHQRIWPCHALANLAAVRCSALG